MSENRRPCSHHIWYEEACAICRRINAPGYRPTLTDGNNNPIRIPEDRPAAPRFYGVLSYLAKQTNEFQFTPGFHERAMRRGSQASTATATTPEGQITFGDFPPSLRYLTIPGSISGAGAGPGRIFQEGSALGNSLRRRIANDSSGAGAAGGEQPPPQNGHPKDPNGLDPIPENSDA